MPETIPLSRLSPTASAIITEITATGPLESQLREAGFLEGAAVRCLQRSPLKDPTAYLIWGAVIALRKETAEQILVRIPCKEETHEKSCL